MTSAPAAGPQRGPALIRDATIRHFVADADRLAAHAAEATAVTDV